jgi:hypothetical protein
MRGAFSPSWEALRIAGKSRWASPDAALDVARLVSHAKAAAQLSITPAGVISERTLRPLAQALNKPKNPMPLPQAQAIAAARRTLNNAERQYP